MLDAVTLFGIVIVVNEVQFLNARYAMVVTLLGILTLVTFVLKNADSPIIFTVTPFIVSGITTLPPEPTYFIIVCV